ncbi:MAG: hypothetical protein WKF30_18230 [Pyrinomonadaceae bacterium]
MKLLLFMAVATTLVAPPFLKRLCASEAAAQGNADKINTGNITSEDEFCRPG